LGLFGQETFTKTLLQQKNPNSTRIHMNRSVALLLVLVLTASSIICVFSVKAEYSGTITIGADGSVNPLISSIQQSGSTYLLTTNIAGNITVQKSNIVLDGNGYKADSVAIGLDLTTGISNVTVKNFIVDGTSGFAVSYSITSRFKYFGLLVFNGSNVLLKNNTIINTRHPGVYVSTVGINIVGGSSNKVIGNDLEKNSDGLSFSHTQDNIVTENNVTANHGWILEFTWGISFFDASNNLIFNNNFIDNYNDPGNYAQVGSEDSINMWDDGTVGNYWSDYDGIDANGDGIGDTPYEVESKNTDHYPLIKPSNISVYLQKITPPRIALLSPIHQMFNESSVPLRFTVDKQVSWMGYSLDGQDNVTVTGNSTLTELTNGLHNMTVYANDTFGNEGASETITFNIDVPEPFPTILVMASVIIVAVVGIGLLVYFKKRKR
jgi:parallel beta-helix repeat protein